ncbi:hypothetical protein QD460_01580 [Rhizobium jaguaris]|uniref:hypothetical protein n=1 Tax=Rhizobium jaguaris TaxID=1312183 RepID=UPI0039BF8300
MGLIAMSGRDLQRIEVLSKVIDGRMAMVSAAHVLAGLRRCPAWGAGVLFIPALSMKRRIEPALQE